jgi:hypothetical protein
MGELLLQSCIFAKCLFCIGSQFENVPMHSSICLLDSWLLRCPHRQHGFGQSRRIGNESGENAPRLDVLNPFVLFNMGTPVPHPSGILVVALIVWRRGVIIMIPLALRCGLFAQSGLGITLKRRLV